MESFNSQQPPSQTPVPSIQTPVASPQRALAEPSRPAPSPAPSPAPVAQADPRPAPVSQTALSTSVLQTPPSTPQSQPAPRTPSIASPQAIASPAQRVRKEATGSDDTPSKRESAATVQLANLVSIQTKKLRELLASASGKPEEYKKYLDDMVKTNEQVEKDLKRVRLRNVELERRSSQLETDVLTATKQLHEALTGELTVEERANEIKSQAGSIAQQLQQTKTEQAKTFREAQLQIESLQADLQTLQSKFDTSQSELSQSQAQVAALQSSVDSLTSKLRSSEEAEVFAKQQSSAIQARLAEAEVKLKELGDSSDNKINAALAQYQQELASAKAADTTRRATISAALDSQSALLGQLQAANHKLSLAVSQWESPAHVGGTSEVQLASLNFSAAAEEPNGTAHPLPTVVDPSLLAADRSDDESTDLS